MPRFLLSCVLVATVLLGACDTTAPQPDQQVVVEAYLRAKAPLGIVRLARTVGPEATHDPTEATVRGADVSVERRDGEGGASVPYMENDSIPGVYEPTRFTMVEPATTYELQVQTPDGAEVTATTTVPEALDVVESRNDTTVYQSADQPALTVPATARGDEQNVFIFTTTSLLDFGRPEPELRSQLTPFYRSNYEPEEDTLEAFRITSSGLLNEGNYNRNNGTITIRLPWFALAFFGPNELAINVVDDNLYDFLRTQQAQQSGFSAQQPGLGPGEIPNVLDHVEGGTGLFGSFAQASRTVLIQRPSPNG